MQTSCLSWVGQMEHDLTLAVVGLRGYDWSQHGTARQLPRGWASQLRGSSVCWTGSQGYHFANKAEDGCLLTTPSYYCCASLQYPDLCRRHRRATTSERHHSQATAGVLSVSPIIIMATQSTHLLTFFTAMEHQGHTIVRGW
jgi:hypothetical protein